MGSSVSLQCVLFLFLANVLLCRSRGCPYVHTRGELINSIAKSFVRKTYSTRFCFKYACENKKRRCKFKHCVALLYNDYFCFRFDNAFMAMNMIKDSQVKPTRKRNLMAQKVQEDVILPLPAGHWMFDEKSKGKNLGAKGKLLNCYDRRTDTYGMSKSFQFTAIGPKGSESNRAYVVTPGTRAACSIYLWDKGKLLLDVQKPLTIAFWIKTSQREAHMPILEGRPFYTFDLWLYPSRHRDQLTLCPRDITPNNQLYTTVRNTTGINDWRHMAVVFRGPGNVTFYLNGDIWPHTNPKKLIPGVKQPYYFNVFNYGRYQVPFESSMACLIYYENFALTQPQIRLLKDNCH